VNRGPTSSRSFAVAFQCSLLRRLAQAAGASCGGRRRSWRQFSLGAGGREGGKESSGLASSGNHPTPAWRGGRGRGKGGGEGIIMVADSHFARLSKRSRIPPFTMSREKRKGRKGGEKKGGQRRSPHSISRTICLISAETHFAQGEKREELPDFSLHPCPRRTCASARKRELDRLCGVKLAAGEGKGKEGGGRGGEGIRSLVGKRGKLRFHSLAPLSVT